MSTPSTPTIAAPPGPDWLAEWRDRAVRRAEGLPLPSPREEVWRYSRIAELDLDAFGPAAAPTAAEAEVAARVLEQFPGAAATVVVVDGWIDAVTISGRVGPDALRVGPVGDAAGDRELFGAVAAPDGADLFAALNDARTPTPLVIEVADGQVIDGPIVVVQWLATAGVAAFPRTVVRIGTDAEASVLQWQGSEDVEGLVVPVTDLVVGRAGRLRYQEVQVHGPSVWQLGSLVSRVEADATLVAGQVGLGGDYARSRTDCVLAGRGASGDLLAVYFGEGDQTLDFRTFQHHVAPDTTSNLLFKGAVADRSRSVYTGLIKVGHEATGTNAFQTNRNIKLSDEAWAESVPNLEIETNDVRCSHASAVGPIDEDQRFYLESRGVPPEVTERLVVTGFFDEVLDRFPVEGVAPLVRAEIVRRLERHETSPSQGEER